MYVCNMYAHAPVHPLLDALVTRKIANMISTCSLPPANLLVHIIKNEEMVGLVDIPDNAESMRGGYHSQTTRVCVNWEEQARVRYLELLNCRGIGSSELKCHSWERWIVNSRNIVTQTCWAIDLLVVGDRILQVL